MDSIFKSLEKVLGSEIENTLVLTSLVLILFIIWAGRIRKDITIPAIKGTKNITSISFIAVVIFPYTPRITRTKEPEMPGKRNAVKAKRPAKISRNRLLKSNSTNDNEMNIATIKPKIKSKRYLKESLKDWSKTQFLITAISITTERKSLSS